MRSSRSPFPCPVCGETVPAGAKSCPECGACERSGWSDDAATDGLDLPDDDFDYEKFVEEEFGEKTAKKSPREKLWWIVALVLAVAFALLLLRP